MHVKWYVYLMLLALGHIKLLIFRAESSALWPEKDQHFERSTEQMNTHTLTIPTKRERARERGWKSEQERNTFDGLFCMANINGMSAMCVLWFQYIHVCVYCVWTMDVYAQWNGCFYHSQSEDQICRGERERAQKRMKMCNKLNWSSE